MSSPCITRDSAISRPSAATRTYGSKPPHIHYMRGSRTWVDFAKDSLNPWVDFLTPNIWVAALDQPPHLGVSSRDLLRNPLQTVSAGHGHLNDQPGRHRPDRPHLLWFQPGNDGTHGLYSGGRAGLRLSAIRHRPLTITMITRSGCKRRALRPARRRGSHSLNRHPRWDQPSCRQTRYYWD
jgi:hypothetical protein